MLIKPIILSKSNFCSSLSNKTSGLNNGPTLRKDYSSNYSNSNILSFKGIRINSFMNHRAISFMGYPVHIVDGSNHAQYMSHFAKAVENKMDIDLHEVEVNLKDKNIKQLKSLEKELKKLNSMKIEPNSYIAIPALASVPLLNLQDQIKEVTGISVKLNAENVKRYKNEILNFLEAIYNNPEKYRKFIDYMDTPKQGLEYSWGVIQEINKLKAKGLKVYIPAGHPHDGSIKWLAKQRGLNSELYNYIATGIDKDNKIKELAEEVKKLNWYSFNLLALSNAEVVTVKGINGAQDYMFAAYDQCITDGARGVYNLSPVRDGGKIIGYSYTDTTTNQYPYSEFPANKEIENILKFVGMDIKDVLASEEETKKLLFDSKNAPDKLYKIEDVFSDDEIKKNKINIQGDYVDKTLKTFYRINSENKVIFPKCDCEGSGKPSVHTMWGSCFAVFNAIARDIRKQERKKLFVDNKEIIEYKSKAKSDEEKGYLEGAEYYYNKILEILEIQNASEEEKYEYNTKLAKVLIKQNKYESAKVILNKLIDIKSTQLERDCGIKYIEENENEILNKILTKQKERFLGEELYHNTFKNKIIMNIDKSNIIKRQIATQYSLIGDICSKLKEDYAAKVCKWAASEIFRDSKYGIQIIKRRLEKNTYIGDLYNENCKA